MKENHRIIRERRKTTKQKWLKKSGRKIPNIRDTVNDTCATKKSFLQLCEKASDNFNKDYLWYKFTSTP